MIGDVTFDLATISNLTVIGFGTAAEAMAQGGEAVLGDRITAGCGVTKCGHAFADQGCAVLCSCRYDL